MISCDLFTFKNSSMSKRSATETISSNGQPYPKASGSGAKRSDTAPNEMGEFEDAWEDEIESDEEVINRKGEDGQYVLGSLLFLSVQSY